MVFPIIMMLEFILLFIDHHSKCPYDPVNDRAVDDIGLDENGPNEIGL